MGLALFTPRIDPALQCRWERCTLLLPCEKPSSDKHMELFCEDLHRPKNFCGMHENVRTLVQKVSAFSLYGGFQEQSS